MKIGNLRLIPKGTKVHSIALQEVIIFDRDIVVKITNLISNDNYHFFGTIQLVLFDKFPGVINAPRKNNSDNSPRSH